VRPITTYHYRDLQEVVITASTHRVTQATRTNSLVLSLCRLSFFRLVRKQGRKKIGNEEMKEGKGEGKGSTEVLYKSIFALPTE
jgi:hypothetical protein